MFLFYTPLKKLENQRLFLEGIKWKHWRELGQSKREPGRNISLATCGERDSHFHITYILEKIIEGSTENLMQFL